MLFLLYITGCTCACDNNDHLRAVHGCNRPANGTIATKVETTNLYLHHSLHKSQSKIAHYIIEQRHIHVDTHANRQD